MNGRNRFNVARPRQRSLGHHNSGKHAAARVESSFAHAEQNLTLIIGCEFDDIVAAAVAHGERGVVDFDHAQSIVLERVSTSVAGGGRGAEASARGENNSKEVHL